MIRVRRRGWNAWIVWSRAWEMLTGRALAALEAEVYELGGTVEDLCPGVLVIVPRHDARAVVALLRRLAATETTTSYRDQRVAA